VPLIVLTGKEYGSGSSRDWAAKGANCSASSRCWRRETVRAERSGDGTEFTVTVRIDTLAEAVESESPALDEPALAADDIVHECGLGSFPASDPPSWWAAGSN
jgi:Aconitase C-terminal domain